MEIYSLTIGKKQIQITAVNINERVKLKEKTKISGSNIMIINPSKFKLIMTESSDHINQFHFFPPSDVRFTAVNKNDPFYRV